MEITIRTYFWDKDKTKILGQRTTVLTDYDICDIINTKFYNEDYGIPVNLERDDLIFDSSIDEIKIN